MNKIKQLFISLLLFSFFVSTALAQRRNIQPDNVFTGERVFEYEQITGDSSRTFGTIYERITRDVEVGIIEIIFLQELPNATLTDTLLVNAQTFLPIRYRSVVPQLQDILINYSIPGNTIIDIQRNIPNQQVDTTLTIVTISRVYDYHWPHTLLYALGPLETEDDVINLPVFTYRNKKSMQAINYTGTRPVELHNKTYQAVVWKVVDPQSGTEHTYWIDRNTNRLLQSRAYLSNGVVFWFRRKTDAKG